MRCVAILVFVLASTTLVFAQGPCTEAAVKEGKVQLAKNAFSYMPPFGKPVTGKEAIQDTAEKKFAGRTNIKHSWESDHRIVTSASGDMAMVQVSFRPPQQSARRSWLAHRMGRLLHTSQIPSSELAMPTRSI